MSTTPPADTTTTGCHIADTTTAWGRDWLTHHTDPTHPGQTLCGRTIVGPGHGDVDCEDCEPPDDATTADITRAHLDLAAQLDRVTAAAARVDQALDESRRALNELTATTAASYPSAHEPPEEPPVTNTPPADTTTATAPLDHRATTVQVIRTCASDIPVDLIIEALDSQNVDYTHSDVDEIELLCQTATVTVEWPTDTTTPTSATTTTPADLVVLVGRYGAARAQAAHEAEHGDSRRLATELFAQIRHQISTLTEASGGFGSGAAPAQDPAACVRVLSTIPTPAAHPDPDHPERHCGRCGGPNVPWVAPSPLWNAVIRGGTITGAETHGGIVCPSCFAVHAEHLGVARDWRLTAQQVLVPLETVTPTGRVWSADTWLWEEPVQTPAAPAQTAADASTPPAEGDGTGRATPNGLRAAEAVAGGEQPEAQR